MSQHGTPFGAVTLLNQVRMSAGTSSNCPLSNASAAPATTDEHESRAICANLRMRSSKCVDVECIVIGCVVARAVLPVAQRFEPALNRDARSKLHRYRRRVDALRNQITTSCVAVRSAAVP